jgi:endonuclease/exonuclease/phosphatase family metal-dependent hydrolase
MTVVPAAGPGRLRVVTWNVHHGVGQDGRLDVGRIADTLAAFEPDVVGLQEVDRGFRERSGWADQAAELADRLGTDLLWAPALHGPPRAPGGRPGEYGVALLSRWPARQVQAVPMALPGHEPRVVLHARVETAPAEVTVLVTHLDFADKRARRRQAEMIAGLSVAGPAVLLGDLNARPAAPELAPLRGWRDAWAAAPRRSGGSWPFAGATVSALPTRLAAHHLVGRTQPARYPIRRVDAVLLRGGVLALAAQVPAVTGSDHRPLVVDLEVPHPA